MRSNNASIQTVVGKCASLLKVLIHSVNSRQFCRLLFRRKISIFDFDRDNHSKAIKVLNLHRMGDAVMHIFYRKSLFLFHDPTSGYSYDIFNLELD